MKEFFEALKQEREKRGISLQELHERTRLPIHILQAIEAGELEKLPAGYDRLYIRRYAKEIGLNPDEVARDFDLFTGRKSPARSSSTESTPLPQSSPPVAPPRAEPSRRAPGRLHQTLSDINWDFWYRIIWGVGILVILVIIGYFSYQQYSQVTRQQVEIQEISVPQLFQEIQTQTALAAEQKKVSAEKALPAPSFTVILKGKARTWIREIRDGTDTTEYILPKGLKRTIEARERVKFTIGRADGVEIILNGVPLEPLGDSTQVVTSLVLSPEGIIQKYVRTPKKAKPQSPQTSLVAPSPTLRPLSTPSPPVNTPED